MTTDGVTYGWAIKYGNAEPVNLMICDVLPITSFGFEPDAYLGGVPSMKALKVVYKAWSETTSCNPATATGEVWAKATTNSYVRPVIAGTYYLNPSSATKEQVKEESLYFLQIKSILIKLEQLLLIRKLKAMK